MDAHTPNSRTFKTLGGRSSSPTPTVPTWQLDLLILKLRQKSKVSSLLETAKSIRSSILERRSIVDTADNQRSLDQLQQSIKVNSLQTMVDKLEMVTRQQGLKFTRTGNEWFISSDMFYLELLIDTNGIVQEVKIQHEGKAEQHSCPEIVQSLQRHDFKDLAAHLEGLVSIYQLNADKKTKSKVFIALQALESDLSVMAQCYNHLSDGEMIVMKSLLGILQPRKGGHPIKLIFYVSPYEFLDMDAKKIAPADVPTIIQKGLGTVATVSVQAYSLQKLQMSTTVSILRTPDGKTIPRYGTLNATNSTLLNACFTVNLKTPIPICRDLLQSIHSTTGINSFDTVELTPMLSLITNHASNGTLDCKGKSGLSVNLPDQNHCYFMTETGKLEGLMISSIAFTLASQLPQVIATLRQQLCFNTLVASCVRVDSKPASEAIVFEINALSHQNLTVSFQHPLEDSLVTLEFDLRDVSHPQCQLHAISAASDIIPTLEEYACKVVHRTMSIPVTLRAVIRRWQTMKLKIEPSNPRFSIPVSGSFNPKPTSHPNDLSCAAESERFQNQQQQSQQHSQQVPGMVMNWSNSVAGLTPNPSFTISAVSPIQATTFPNQTPMELVPQYITLQNLNQISFNSQMVNMLASQIQNQQVGGPKQSASALLNLFEQVGQNRRRKRKNEASISPAHTSTSMLMPRPSPSPSPKSPRLPSAKRSPKRRPSDGSEESSPRVPTPTTPSNSGIGHMMMSEFGLDGEPRWNIDITPVGPGMDTTFSKILSNFGSEYQTLDDSDVEIESEIQGKFPLKLLKKNRDLPKRSMSLDSSVKDPQGQSAHNLHSLFDSSNDAFKPHVTPSLSITPVSGASSASVNSILASMRPGIEIIPLPNPVNIPHSITVTPILPKPSVGDKVKKSIDDADGRRGDSNSTSSKKMSENRKRKFDESNKSISFGNIQIKSISKSGVNNIKRSNSVNPPPRPVLPKGGSLGANASIAALSKGMSGGKPGVSTLKSVSSSPTNNSTNQLQQLTSKTKINRDKNKSGSSSGTLPKLQKLQQSPSGGMKIESSHGPPLPKLEPMIPGSGIKLEQTNSSKGDQTSKGGGVSQKPGPLGAIKKSVGLLAVIDKLKLQHTDDGSKKEVGKGDLVKSSSDIGMKVKTQSPIGLGGTSVSVQGTGNPPGSEYMIKPGAVGQGLKLTINKTKGPHPKDKFKGIGILKSSGGVPGLKKGLTPSRIPSPKLTPPSNTPKKAKPESMMSGQGKMSGMKGSPTGGHIPKPKSEGELDLTKKLFMSGSAGIFDGPKFDTKFQIPKKSRIIPPPVAPTEKVEDLSMGSKKEKEGSDVNFETVPTVCQTPPQVEAETGAEPPPTLTLAASDVETSEKMDEQPPVLSAEVSFEPSSTTVIDSQQNIGPVSSKTKSELEFISPESPDPIPVNEESKSTPTIPTTPISQQPEPSPIPEEPFEPESTSTPVLIYDDDNLVMGIPAFSETTHQSQINKFETLNNKLASSGFDDGEGVKSMPPPPRPSQEFQGPAAVPAVPSSPIVSIHIVHSPQPKSPALLRSPLVVQSPRSHSSPYAIDDDLMDEALIG